MRRPSFHCFMTPCLILALALALCGHLQPSHAQPVQGPKKKTAPTQKKTAPAKKKAASGPSLMQEMLKNSEERILPVHRLTSGPLRHWFSYYDVAQFDPSGRYVLCMAVPFEFRQPAASDAITIGMIDLKDNDRWTTLGTTTAWCWQQGCRLQWRPGSDHEVLWNDREDGKYVCRILDLKTKKVRTLPTPIDHLSPDGKWALVADYARTGMLRCAYGYQGIEDPARDQDAPASTGAWQVNLDTGEKTLLFSLADVAAIPSIKYKPGQKGRHYLNHFGWAPDGKRFLVLNRGEGVDRMFVADADGKNLHFICEAPSHFCWRDPDTILCWTNNAYRLFKADGTGSPEGEILFKAPNGHQTYLPGGEWLLTDTYPQGKETDQYLYLYNFKSGRKIIVGKFNQPAAYREARDKRGEPFCRCDTHPRLSPDFTKVTIDSTHEDGRQLYLVDISAIVGRK